LSPFLSVVAFLRQRNQNSMGKLHFPMMCLLSILFAGPAWAGQQIKNIKVAITNPSSTARSAADIVIPVAEIRKVAPDFKPGAVIVTASDASTLEEDASAEQTEELPSQADDLDGDRKADELAFQIDLAPKQTRVVTISYGDENRIWRLRSDYKQRTAAIFSRKIEGVGWESEQVAFRIYFDPRNAIDIYGKRRPTLQLGMYAAPDYVYHDESPEGRDIFEVGDSIGIGAVAGMVDGKLIKVADVKDRKWQILASGPVRSIVELEYDGWNAAGKMIHLRSRITQWTGERGFEHAISADCGGSFTFVTGLPVKTGISPVESGKDSPVTWIASWGEQVVAPGAKATEELRDQNLGLAVLTAAPEAKSLDDAKNHLVEFHLKNSEATWYAMAAWDQEGSNRKIGFWNGTDKEVAPSFVLPSNGITRREQFLDAVRDEAVRIEMPATVRILSSSSNAEPAPADTLVPHGSKTIEQAIELLRQNIDRTATTWEPILRGSPEPISSKEGEGFFTEADNKSGEWQKQKGYSWTGSFWIGELWRLYAATHNEKYRTWAELWGSKLIGQESLENHDAGFLNYYSAALGYDLTREDKLKDSAMRGVERLEQLFNPKTQLIASWNVGGDDTIVDTMMNLQLLWWASDRSGDEKWREIGKKHALRTAEWFVRPDGSVFQSVHYNPGDNPQIFDLHGGVGGDRGLKLENNAAPGEWVFKHTHQGYGPDTTWSRGLGWAIYGFSVAYAETHEPVFLTTAQRIADYALDNLPGDSVPSYDFDDEGVHFRNRDTSAAAIIAGGLFRLSTNTTDTAQAAHYRDAGERIVHSLIDNYLTPVGDDDRTPPGVLRHGSGVRPHDAMLIYGQYYLLEDLLWLEQHPHEKSAQTR
jgi:unsaturated chondroitin disaccharide hydrolase